MLRAQNLHILRGRKAVLSDVWLQVEPGEVLGVLGPNGAGKVRYSVPCAVSWQRAWAGFARRASVEPLDWPAARDWRCCLRCRPWILLFALRKWSAWAACLGKAGGCGMPKSSHRH